MKLVVIGVVIGVAIFSGLALVSNPRRPPLISAALDTTMTAQPPHAASEEPRSSGTCCLNGRCWPARERDSAIVCSSDDAPSVEPAFLGPRPHVNHEWFNALAVALDCRVGPFARGDIFTERDAAELLRCARRPVITGGPKL